MFYLYKRSSALRHSSRICIWILAFVWISGLICGVMYAAYDATIISLMRMVCFNCVSIVGLATILILPLLISAVAVYFSKPAVIYLLSAFKAFSSGYCIYGTLAVYGSAGWLIRLLLLFSDTCITVVLMWFWIRHISGSKRALTADTAVCTVLAGLIGIIDYTVVSPFLVTLVDHI